MLNKVNVYIDLMTEIQFVQIIKKNSVFVVFDIFFYFQLYRKISCTVYFLLLLNPFSKVNDKNDKRLCLVSAFVNMTCQV